MRRDGFDFYQMYLAFVAHFNATRGYDFFKYSGKTNLTEQGYFKDPRRKYLCAGLTRKIERDNIDPVLFLYASFRHGYAPLKPISLHKAYKCYMEEVDCFRETLIRDLATLHKYRNSPVHQNQLHPYVWVLYNDGLINEMTLQFISIYIDDFMQLEASVDPLLWKEEVEKFNLRRGFLKLNVFCLYDTDELISIVRNSAWIKQT